MGGGAANNPSYVELRVCFEIFFAQKKEKMFKNIFRIAVQEAFPPRTRGRPALLGFDDAYDDIVHIVRTGMQWRSLQPKAAVAYITVFKTMHKWIDAGLFRTAYERLLRLYRRRRKPRYCCVTFVKNVYGVDCVGRNPTDRGRMATKLSAAVDDAGVRSSAHLVTNASPATDTRCRHCSHPNRNPTLH